MIPIRSARKHQLNSGMAENIAVMLVKRTGCDRFHILLFAVFADPVGFSGEHLLTEPHGRINPFIIDLRHNGVAEIDLFPVHIILTEHTVIQHGFQQKAPQQIADIAGQVLFGFCKSFVDVVKEETDGLNLSFFSDDRLHAGTVSLIQPGGDFLHIRADPAAAKQDIRQKRIKRSFFPSQGPKDVQGKIICSKLIGI